MKIRDKSITGYLLLCLIVSQLILIVFTNLLKANAFLDYDSALAIRHGWEMWKHGLFLKDFNYFSTMEIDCAGFIAAGLYALSNNLGLSEAIAQLIIYISIAAVIYDLFDNLKIGKKSFALALFLIFTPFSVGQLEWANMIFISVGQYGFRILLMLLFIDMFVMCEQKASAKFYILVLVTFFLNFWSSLSTGNYVLFMISSPIILKVFIDTIRKQEIHLLSRVNVVLFSNIMVSIAGWIIREWMIGQSSRNNLSLIKDYDFIPNLGKCFTGVLLLFGGLAKEDGIYLISVRGIVIIISWCFSMFCIFYLGYSIFMKNRKMPFFMFDYTVCYMFVHLTVLTLTKTNYGGIIEFRYHILWCVLLLVFVAGNVMQRERYRNNWLYHCIVYGLLLCVGIINFAGFKTCLQGYKERGLEPAISKLARELDAAVYFYKNNTSSHVFRAIAPDIYCVCVEYEDGQMQMDMGDFYRFYGDNSIAGDNNILVAYDLDFEELPEYIKATYRLIGETNEGYNIYYSKVNRWDGCSGFSDSMANMAVDYPFSNNYQYKGVINNQGILISGTEEEEYVLCGPLKETREGTYDITLSYNITIAGDQAARLQVVTDQNRVLSETVLTEELQRVELSEVKIEMQENVQVRVWKPEGMELGIEKIVFRNLS